MNSNRSAFTLMELMIVVAIMGLLVAIAIPSIKGIGGSQSVTTAVTSLNGILNNARQEAITKNTYVAVAFSEFVPDDDPDKNYVFWIVTFTKNSGEKIDCTTPITIPGNDYQLTGAPRSFERFFLKDQGKLTTDSLSLSNVDAANIDSLATANTTVNFSGKSLVLPHRLVFTPRGEALAADELNQYIEFGIVSAQDPSRKNPAVFRISGNLGTLTVYRN